MTDAPIRVAFSTAPILEFLERALASSAKSEVASSRGSEVTAPITVEVVVRKDGGALREMSALE
jgi:hypothetical protein